MGEKLPLLTHCCTRSANGVFFNTLPNTPPAPTRIRIGPAWRMASSIHWLKIFVSFLFTSNKLNSKPVSNAIIGLPKKSNTFFSMAGIGSSSAAEPAAINNTGTITGKILFQNTGSCINSSAFTLAPVSCSLIVFKKREANNQHIIVVGILTARPVKITVPKCWLRPRLAAPASEPGCGGKKV